MRLQRNVSWLVLVASFLLPPGSMAQTVYTIPFASTGNTIELTIVNTSPVAAANVEVRTDNVPVWLKIATHSQRLNQIDAHGETLASFSFSVDKSAPVGQEQALSFVISSSTGGTWTKQIKIRVTPPVRFELFQNYPNPFNPRTTIAYQLPSDGKVSLKVFNVLGQEVAKLVEMEKQAGYYQESFEAGHLASGVYIYRLIYTLINSEHGMFQKKMLVMK